MSLRKRGLVAMALTLGALGIGQSIVWAVDCNCPCAKTHTTDVAAAYTGIQNTCKTNSSSNISGSVSGGGFSGSGSSSGSGTYDAVCIISYTETDFHRSHAGGVDACTKVDDDGRFAQRVWSGGNCIFHDPLFSSAHYHCQDLTQGTTTYATNQITHDCPGGVKQ